MVLLVSDSISYSDNNIIGAAGKISNRIIQFSGTYTVGGNIVIHKVIDVNGVIVDDRVHNHTGGGTIEGQVVVNIQQTVFI